VIKEREKSIRSSKLVVVSPSSHTLDVGHLKVNVAEPMYDTKNAVKD